MEIRKAPNDTTALSFVANSEAARYVFVVVAAADVMDRGRRYGTFVLACRARSEPSLRVVRMHRAPRVRTFGPPPPAHPVASRRREARAPRGRAPCRHNSTSQQSTSCVSVSGFAAVGVRNPTGDRANFQSDSHAPPPWRSRLAHSARLVEEEFALCGF